MKAVCGVGRLFVGRRLHPSKGGVGLKSAAAEASWVPMPDEISFCPATVLPDSGIAPLS